MKAITTDAAAPMADQLLTATNIRNVISSSINVANNKFVCVLSCGHTISAPGVHVRGTRFSLRAPFTAPCNQCPKESTNG